MISLFKPNDPIRLFLGFFLITILSFPLYWYNLPITKTEILYNLIGTKINSGAFMYKDIWDYTGLFTSLTYAGTNYLNFSANINTILAIIILFFISIKTTINLNKNEVYPQKNYITIYFFILSIFSSFVLLKLSSQLLSLIFLTFAMNIVLKHFSGHIHDEDRILLGFWHGIASLFYFPCTLFFVIHLLFFASFTKLRLSSYLLSFFGFIIPYFFVGIIYYTQGAIFDFINRGIIYYFQFNFRSGIGFEKFILISLPMIIVILIGYFSLFSQFHNNIQSTTKALMIMWFFCFFIIMFWTDFDVYNLIYLCIPFAYFCTYMFLVIKHKITYTILSFGIPLIILLLFWTDLVSPIREKPELSLIARKELAITKFKNKKILVLGDNIEKYQNQKLATKYLYWPMAQKQIKKINSFAGLTMIYTSLIEDLPEVIIDDIYLMPKLQSCIPEFNKIYKTKDSKIYYLIK